MNISVNRPLFSSSKLSSYLQEQLKMILYSIDIKADLNTNAEPLKKISEKILRLELDTSYKELEDYVDFTSRSRFSQKYKVMRMRFIFKGDYRLFSLIPESFNSNAPEGCLKQNYLYFDLYLPFTEDIQKFNENALKEFNKYNDNISFYIENQKQDIESFITDNWVTIKNRINYLKNDDEFKKNIFQDFDKAIKNNLLVKQSTPVPEDEKDRENFIEELRKNRK